MNAIRVGLTWIHRVYQSHWYTKFVVGPLVIGLPPVLISLQPQEWRTTHLTLCVLAGIWSGLAVAVAKGIREFVISGDQEIDTSGLATLITILDGLVGRKGGKVAAKALQMAGQKLEPGELLTVVDPESAIEEIVSGVWHYFDHESLRKGGKEEKPVLIKVVLAEMGPKHIVKYRHCLPHDHTPRSTIASLQKPSCTYSRAKEKRQMIIVENLPKEGQKNSKDRNFLSNPERADEPGSMICFPITLAQQSEVPYVISIWASKNGFFHPGNKREYQYVLERFQKRLVMEHGWQILKECCNGRGHKTDSDTGSANVTSGINGDLQGSG